MYFLHDLSNQLSHTANLCSNSLCIRHRDEATLHLFQLNTNGLHCLPHRLAKHTPLEHDGNGEPWVDLQAGVEYIAVKACKLCCIFGAF